jgi:hypothetical protein
MKPPRVRLKPRAVASSVHQAVEHVIAHKGAGGLRHLGRHAGRCMAWRMALMGSRVK